MIQSMTTMIFKKKSECKFRFVLATTSRGCYDTLFSGAFGVVHRAVERKTGNSFAAKFVNTPHPADKDAVRNEINIMGQLRHPKLIHLHDAFEGDDEMVMVYEL